MTLSKIAVQLFFLFSKWTLRFALSIGSITNPSFKQENSMRILSGIQPSGLFHLGNYFAMIQRMIKYQKEHDLYLFIASYHAMTTVFDGKQLSENLLQAATDLLALGVDPEKSVFWVQSDVPEVTELSWLLSMSVTVPQLELAHSYKDKTSSGIVPSAGLFTYPILMASDILAFGSERVPVGKDQKQHLEISREIARKFNNQYGETFRLPEPDILEDVALVPGLDGRKMSKSYNNYIYVFAPEKQMRKKVMSIVTDSAGVDEPKNPDDSVLFDLYSLFLDEQGKEKLKERFRTPGEGYGPIKQDLFETMQNFFAPYREKREELMKSPDTVRDILSEGAKKAKRTATEVLDRVRERTGLTY